MLKIGILLVKKGLNWLTVSLPDSSRYTRTETAVIAWNILSTYEHKILRIFFFSFFLYLFIY